MSKKATTLSTNRALRKFGFRQTLRGGVIIGLLTGLMMGAQGAAYAEAYPDQHSRDIFVASLKSVPSLGFMAGEIDDALTPASYSIYKSITLMTLLTGIWGLLVTTRLLRGQEEDGRMEQIVSGRTTLTKATAHILIGYCYSLVIAFVIAWLIIAGLGASPKVDLSFGAAGLLTLGVFMPGIFFTGLGVLASQLALTRGRAIAYGLIPLLVFFVIRGTGNSVSDWNDLKKLSPFGWTDLLNPVRHADATWLIPSLLFFVIFVFAGLYFTKKRDLGSSIIPQSQYAKARTFLLGSAYRLSLRQNISTFIWWTIGTVAFSALLAAIAKVGADALASSPAFANVIGKLGGSYDDLVIAFIGFGGLFTALILLVMATVVMGSVRNQEAKGYVDNLFIQPVQRTAWLGHRLLLTIAMIWAISMLSGYTVWQIAMAQGVPLDLGIITQNATALIGTVILLIGIGAFIYGALPRMTTIVMYTVIIWAFVVDVLKSFLSLDDWIDKTSLLHYVSFAPTTTPDWVTFWWLIGIGLVLAAIGLLLFRRRDIVPE